MKLKTNPIYRTLDKLFEFIIKDRAGWRCELCLATDDGLEAHHIISCRHLWTRWDRRNGVAVCRGGCHDNVKVMAWLKETDPRRYRWIIRQRAKVRHGERINMKTIERRLRLLEQNNQYSIVNRK